MKTKKQEKNAIKEVGVNQFINRLKTKGINEGKIQGDQIISEANKKADKILSNAKKEAEQMLSKAKETIAKQEKSAKESINIAFRDSVLKFENSLTDDFVKTLKGMVKNNFTDKEFLKELILEIVKNLSGKNEIYIIDDEKINPSVYGITKKMLDEGIEISNLKTGLKNKKGIVIKNQKQGIEIDLTDESVSEMLLENLLPKYQELIKK
jgi:V/A-type H+-transporting ATPase subunit E